MPAFSKLIADSGLSITKLAKKAGWSYTAFRNWSRGQVPSLDSRRKLEKFFGVTEITYGEPVVEENCQTLHLEVKDPLKGKPRKDSKFHSINRTEEFALMQIIKRIGFDEAMRRLVE